MTRDPKIYLQLGGTGLLTRAYRRRGERKGLEAIFTSQKEGMRSKSSLVQLASWPAYFSLCLCVISSGCVASSRTVGRHHLLSSHVWITCNTLSDMRRW